VEIPHGTVDFLAHGKEHRIGRRMLTYQRLTHNQYAKG
jgi:hypothetical protein